MPETYLSLAGFIPLCPLVAFFAILIFGKKLPGKGAYVAIAAMVVAWVMMILVDLTWVIRLNALGNHAPAYEVSYNWLNLTAPTDHIQMGFMVDSATAVLLFVVTTVGTLIFWFAAGYMEGDPWYPRFFAYVSLFAAAMLGVVVSNNLLLFFMSWEIMGLCSYFLIGFWYDRPSAMRAAKKAFVVTRVGDVGFFIGMLTLYYTTTAHTFNFAQIFSSAELNHLRITQWNFMGVSVSAATIIALLIFCGSVGKSAQFPLHVWLPDAMEGPTPVSALIHAATMVAAGVFLVARMYPVFAAPTFAGQPSVALMVVAAVGGFTALFAATMGVPNNDIKRVLAYSTISQLGYMFMALGCFGYTAALFHLMTHACFKALLFLGAGSVYHATHTYDMRQMGGLRKKMPVTGITFLIGSLALSGIFPLSGFWSKDAILGQAYRANGPFFKLIFAFGMVAAFLTAFYTFRMYFMTFEGKPRDAHIDEHVHESHAIMTYPLIGLAVLASLIGLIGIPFETTNWFGHRVFYELPQTLSAPETTGFTLGMFVISLVVAFTGIWCALNIYGPDDIPLLNRVRLQWAMPDVLWRQRPYRHRFIPGWYNTAAHLYYMDDFYTELLVKPTLGASGMTGQFDQFVVDGGMVDGSAWLTVWFSRINNWVDQNIVDGLVRLVGAINARAGNMLRDLQQGVIQVYALFVFVSVLALILFVYYVR